MQVSCYRLAEALAMSAIGFNNNFEYLVLRLYFV